MGQKSLKGPQNSQRTKCIDGIVRIFRRNQGQLTAIPESNNIPSENNPLTQNNDQHQRNINTNTFFHNENEEMNDTLQKGLKKEMQLLSSKSLNSTLQQGSKKQAQLLSNKQLTLKYEEIPRVENNNTGQNQNLSFPSQVNAGISNLNDTIKKGQKKQTQSLNNKQFTDLSKQISELSFQNQEYDQNVEYGLVEIGDTDKLDRQDEYSLNENEEQEIIEQSRNYFLIHSNLNPNQADLILRELNRKGLHLGEFIAKGGEGIVFSGFMDSLGFQKQVVLKIVINSELEEIKQEVSIITRFEQYLNVVGIYELIQIKPDISVMVLEKCKYSLKKELDNIRTIPLNFPLEKLFQIIFDLFDGLISMKIFQILHLDIKPDNILINKNGKYLFTDFGLSQIYSKTNKQVEIKGFTRKYAPLEQRLFQAELIQSKTDTYSLGLTIQEVIQTFKNGNQDYQIVQQFEKEILDLMVTSDIESRMDCQKCHEKLIQILLNTKEQQYKHILFAYQPRINYIELLEPNDLNKDIPFFRDIKIYYLRINIMIQKLFIEDQKLQYGLKSERESIQLIKRDIKDSYDDLTHIFYTKQEYQKSIQCALESLYLSKELFEKRPEIIADSLDRIGDCYLGIHDEQLALDYYLASLQIREQLLKVDPLDISESLNNIGTCYLRMGEYQISLKYHFQSYFITNQLFKGNHLGKSRSLVQIGECFKNIGNFNLALTYLEYSLVMLYDLFQKINDPQFAIIFTEIGICHSKINNYEMAIQYLQKALEIRKVLYRENDPIIIDSLQKIGECYSKMGDYANAITYYQQSLKITKEVYEVNHPATKKYLNNLGSEHLNIRDFETAYNCELGSERISKELFKRTHELIAISLQELGMCFENITEYKKALNYYLQSLNMKRVIFKGEHEDIADSLNIIGLLYRKIGDNEKAIRYLKQAHKMMRFLKKHNHPDIAITLDNLGLCYQNKGDYIKALNYNLGALQIFRQQYKGNHRSIATCLNNAGVNYQKIGDIKNALEFLLQSQKMLKQLSADRHNPSYANLMDNIGLVYRLHGKYFKAITHHLFALEFFTCFYTGNHIDKALTLHNLAESYLFYGDYDIAFEYQLIAVKMIEEIFNEGDHIFKSAFKKKLQLCIKLKQTIPRTEQQSESIFQSSQKNYQLLFFPHI